MQEERERLQRGERRREKEGDEERERLGVERERQEEEREMAGSHGRTGEKVKKVKGQMYIHKMVPMQCPLHLLYLGQPDTKYFPPLQSIPTQNKVFVLKNKDRTYWYGQVVGCRVLLCTTLQVAKDSLGGGG